jgi:hypothetical protein
MRVHGRRPMRRRQTMKTVLITTAMLMLATLAMTPSASASYCDFPEVTVDEVQACGNYVVDLGQWLGGWGVETACGIAFGPENC